MKKPSYLTFGDTFKIPEPSILPDVETIPGLDRQKMSKSYGNTIDIFGDEKETRKRVMSIVTDSTPVEAPKNPDASTITQLYSLVASKDEVEEHKHRDPILILRKRLAEVAGLTDDDVKKMEEKVAEEVARAVKFAEESPAPEPEELYRDVVAE